MDIRRTLDSIAVRTIVPPLAVLAAGGIALGGYVHSRMLRDVDTAGMERARALASAVDAAPPRRSAERPMAHFATFEDEAGFRLRNVAPNPTNTHDVPNSYEAGLIQELQANRRLDRIERIAQIDGHRFATVARPIAMSEDRCAICHSLPRVAPAELRRAYGRGGGFGWHRGAVVGASVVYTPLDGDSARAESAFWTGARLAGLLALFALALIGFLLRGVVTAPVRWMADACKAIRQRGPAPAFPTLAGGELRQLGLALQESAAWMREQIGREEKRRALFQQFVPASVAARALGLEADGVLTGGRHPVTVMCINIRKFGLLMENLEPEQTVATLNEYFTAVNSVIIANGGIVSKYLGDSVVAFFGMPVKGQNHALQAVTAALGVPQALQDLYVRLEDRYGWELGVGIGISSGEAIVGHFGSSEHMEYAVLGEVAPEAHRLEEATKGVPEEDSILISEAAYRSVMSEVFVFDLGRRAGSDGGMVYAYAVQGLRHEAATTPELAAAA